MESNTLEQWKITADPNETTPLLTAPASPGDKSKDSDPAEPSDKKSKDNIQDSKMKAAESSSSKIYKMSDDERPQHSLFLASLIASNMLGIYALIIDCIHIKDELTRSNRSDAHNILYGFWAAMLFIVLGTDFFVAAVAISTVHDLVS